MKRVKHKANSNYHINFFMLQEELILTPQEIRICLVLQCLLEELAILISQNDFLESEDQKQLSIILP